METINREVLQKEIHTVLDTLNATTYLPLLHTMARFHKYDISQQINLLLHAPKEASAVATEGIWKRLGYSLKEGAKGIPVLSGYDSTPQLVYDVSDTSAAEENLLWKYDKVLHGDFFEACFPSVKDHGSTETKITDLVTDYILALPSAHIVTDPNDTAQINFLVASVSHIILERMGFPARESIEQQVGGKVEEVYQKYLDAHIGQPLDILHLLEIINHQAASILNPLENYIHGKERIENGRTIESDRRTGGMVSRGNRELPETVPDDRKAEAVEGNRGEREGERIPAEIRGGVRTKVSAADQRPDGETRRDGGTAQSKLAGIRPAGDGGSFPSMGTYAGGNSVVTSTEVSLFDTEDNQNAKEPQQDTAAPSRGKKNAVPEIVHKIIARELSFEEAVQAIGSGEESDTSRKEAPKRAGSDLENGKKESQTIDIPAAIAALSPYAHRVYENNKVADPMSQDVQLEHPDDLSRNPQKSEKKQPADIDLSAFDFSAALSSVSGKRKVFQRNMGAICTLKRLEEENREALPNERALLKSYSGFGGLPEVFDEFDKAWANEYQEIRNALTDEEFSSARASTLNAHYTPTELVRALYDAIETAGFKQGNILDPSIGSGHFIEAMPEEMRKNSHICGVDLDLLSSRLAKKIYPDVAVTNAGFEDTSYEDGSFDLAISNVPFGNYHVSSDVSLRGQHFLIHDYFIAKMIHQVRPGGLVAVITSSGTMDKGNPHLREYIAQRADLICAMRLPNTAFSSAGTKTTTDVLLLKKLDDGRIRKVEEIKSLPWIQAANYSYNPYFRDHPENVLGNLQPQRNPYGDMVTVCLPTENEEQPLSLRLVERLQAAIQASGHPYTPTKAPLPRPHQSQENTQEYRAGYQFKNGQLIYLTEDGTEGKVSLAGKNLAKATSFIKLRDAVKILLNAEEANCSDEEMKELQQELNQLFDEHLRQFGNIRTDKTLPRLAQESSDLFLLYSLEKFDKNGQYIGKEDIFFERTIRPNIVPDSADSVEDALKISMLQKGVVDLSYMASLTKTTVSDITAQLEFTRIFYDYGTQRYQLTEEYLSGDIRKKIDDLKEVRALLQKQVREKALAMRYVHFPNKTQIAAAYPENAFSAPEAQKHQGDPVFILDAMILGHHETLPHYTRGHKTIEYCLDEMKCLRRDTTPYQLLRREKREIALQPEDALWYTFLREKLIAFKAADQDYNIFKNIAEEWSAYQREEERTLEQEILTAEEDSEVAALQKQMNRVKKNLQALEDVKPCDLTAEDIKVSLGATWLDPSLVREFLQDILQLRPYELSQLNIFYSPETGKWKIEHTATDNINVLETYGAPPSHTAFDLCDCALNFKNPVVRMTKMVDGVGKSVVNPKATARAQMQMEKLKNAFQAWLWKDPQRAQKICDTYNRKFIDTPHT